MTMSSTPSSSPPPPASDGGFAPGTFLGSKFRVERVLGRGGMGIVLAATHLELQQQVAIKILHPEMAKDENIVARFLREARSQVRIQGDHIVRVLDLGTLPIHGPYIVMEMLHGMDLADALATRGPMPVEEATDYVLQATEAIAQAHSLGIVHRDLKPQNLFLTSGPDGSPLVKVLDFGIAKTSLAPDATHFAGATTGNGLLGSPAYMSPEQIRRPKDVNASSDIWALGVILYELLTNQIPFHATNLGGLLTAIATDPPVDIRVVRPHLPDGIASVVMRCLSKDPADRPRDVAELAMAIAEGAPARERAIRIAQIVRRLSSRPAGPVSREELAATAFADPSAMMPPIPRPPMLPPDLVANAHANTIATPASANAADATGPRAAAHTSDRPPGLEWVSTIAKPTRARSIGRTIGMGALAAALVAAGVFLATRTTLLQRHPAAQLTTTTPTSTEAKVAPPPAPTPLPTPAMSATTPTPTVVLPAAPTVSVAPPPSPKLIVNRRAPGRAPNAPPITNTPTPSPATSLDPYDTRK